MGSGSGSGFALEDGHRVDDARIMQMGGRVDDGVVGGVGMHAATGSGGQDATETAVPAELAAEMYEEDEEEEEEEEEGDQNANVEYAAYTEVYDDESGIENDDGGGTERAEDAVMRILDNGELKRGRKRPRDDMVNKGEVDLHASAGYDEEEDAEDEEDNEEADAENENGAAVDAENNAAVEGANGVANGVNGDEGEEDVGYGSDKGKDDGNDDSGESTDDEAIILPPRPCMNVFKQHPKLKRAFQNLDAAIEAREESFREIAEAEEEFEEARRRVEDARENGRIWDRTVKMAKRGVITAETGIKNRWNTMFKQLVAYKAEHGNVMVPTAGSRGNNQTKIPKKYAMLSRWVGSQRETYNKMDDPTKPNYIVRKDGAKAHKELQPHRIRALNELGFVWDVTQEAWKANMRDLLEFKRTHGHVNIPAKYKPNPRLGTWVHKTRGLAKRFWEGKPSSMTEERIAELDSVGFIWKSDFPRTLRKHISEYKPRYAMRDKITEEMEWEDSFAQLKAFAEENGHCCIGTREKKTPPTKIRQLGDFVSWQRKQYKLMKEGKPSTLTEERVRRLESIGFFWTSRDVPLPRGYEARKLKLLAQAKEREKEEQERERRGMGLGSEQVDEHEYGDSEQYSDSEVEVEAGIYMSPNANGRG
mmetsp:Transcript_252/g.691  ORF Transcript_252/g.691 Transcript_252/m.691 type:complete len:648 (-) Transcript_252:101-2044(-)